MLYICSIKEKDMKAGITRKEILRLAIENSLFFNPNMTKKAMMEFVEMGLKGDNKRAVGFALAVVEADKQYQRNIKLKALGI